MDVLGLIDIPVWLLMLTALGIIFYFYSTAHFDIFPRMGVKGPRPIPGTGNLHEIMKRGILEAEGDWVKQYGRVYGIHEGRNPVLMVGDLDMLKDITVKHFDCFQNRRDFGSRKYGQPPASRFLSTLADDDWKHNRNFLTPAFSTGKLKRMSPCVSKAAVRLVDGLKGSADSGEPFEVKDVISGYSMEVIASTMFGLEVDASSNHPFLTYALKLFHFSLFNPILLLGMFLPAALPIISLLKLQSVPADSMAFFTQMVQAAMKERRENPGKFEDFLQLMVTAQDQAQAAQVTTHSEGHLDHEVTDQGHWVDKRKGQGLTDDEILAQSIMFLVAGFDTTATSLTNVLYHLALNPKCQDKLIAQIDEHFPNGKAPTYETLNEIPYLDMVISEGLRLNPPLARMSRVCDKSIKINGIEIPAGLAVAMPIYNIHHDPGYWPNPETFDPERFTPENKKAHHPLQWIPFGYGPRNCIGMRLAQMEMKFGLVHVLQKYRFVPNSKTVPLKFGATITLTKTTDGVWLTAQHRQ